MKTEKQLAGFLEILKAVKSHAVHPHTYPYPPNPANTSPCRRVNRVVKGLKSGDDMKSNYRQR